ncbi:hypothetical protein AB0F13_16650 [Streptomyces sp. NPDC026206]|uniref:hypothetical protein n=1 Tax=Streptomyces sp. NPDC026206 TaxID=3157089 RepID=UPI0034075E61
MVDPVSLDAITTAVTAAAGSVGTEAGRQVWGSLVDLTRRALRRGREEDGAPVPLPADPGDQQEVQALAALLFGGIFQDEALTAEYRQWEEQARTVLSVDNSTVTNTVSGNARVGNLYQGRDINVTLR